MTTDEAGFLRDKVRELQAQVDNLQHLSGEMTRLRRIEAAAREFSGLLVEGAWDPGAETPESDAAANAAFYVLREALR